MNARLKVGQDGVAHVYLEDGSEIQDVSEIRICTIRPGVLPYAEITVLGPLIDVALEAHVLHVTPSEPSSAAEAITEFGEAAIEAFKKADVPFSPSAAIYGVTSLDDVVDVLEKGVPPYPLPPAEVEAVAQEEVSAPTPTPRSKKGRA